MMATERCIKCAQSCYPNEKIKSCKAQVYHKACFRCTDCNTSLASGKDVIGPDALLRCKTCFEKVYGRNGSLIAHNNTVNFKPVENTQAVAVQAAADTLEEDLQEIKGYLDQKKWLKTADLISILPSTTALRGLGYLVTACMSGAPVDVVQVCLEFGSEVEETMGSVTPLFCAVGRRNLEAAQCLLEHGANVNALDKYERSPLWTACKNNATAEMAKLLINHGANVNQYDIDKKSVLNVAVSMNQSLEFINVLLSNPALDVNFRDREGFTALHEGYLNADVLAALLKSGADVNACGKRGETVLHSFAANGASIECFQQVLAQGFTKLNERDEYGRTPLHLASAHCSPQVVELLLASGSAIDLLDTSTGRNALEIAIHANRDLDVCETLAQALIKSSPQCTTDFAALAELCQKRDGNSSLSAYLQSLHDQRQQ